MINLSQLKLGKYFNRIDKFSQSSIVRLTRYLLRKIGFGILAQLGEHLPYKQRVIGSSPIGPIGTMDFWNI